MGIYPNKPINPEINLLPNKLYLSKKILTYHFLQKLNSARKIFNQTCL
jgi:hypothetical protein